MFWFRNLNVRSLRYSSIAYLLAACLGSMGAAWIAQAVFAKTPLPTDQASKADSDRIRSDKKQSATAILAGGCFWCVETDFEKLSGVLDVVSGYSGGTSKSPTYENYSKGGHREVVMISYDPNIVTYSGLVEYLIKHIDPTNGAGSFNDDGIQYSPAVYYANDQEKSAASKAIASIDALKVYAKPLAVALLPRAEFWKAEDYHQDYHRKNSLKYQLFRSLSGRDNFVSKHWGAKANVLSLPESSPKLESGSDAAVQTVSSPSKAVAEEKKPARPWENFRKPADNVLRSKLSDTQYRVTQKDATEPAFRNKYWNNHQEGIYVDVVSGEPLFSSHDKFESGTGWPSFVKPIDPKAIVTRVDRSLFSVRTEIRSKRGDSHLGHVFNDGPANRGGLRYCMNSASLRFIPKDKLEEEGYGEFLEQFK